MSVVMAKVIALQGLHEVSWHIPADVATVLYDSQLMGPWIQERATQFSYRCSKLLQLAVHMY